MISFHVCKYRYRYRYENRYTVCIGICTYMYMYVFMYMYYRSMCLTICIHVHIGIWICICMYRYQRWASAILVRTSAIPQYCGLPNRLRNRGLKKLRKCHCGPSKFDFRNSATLCNLQPVPLLYSPFSSAQDPLKINQKQCIQSSVSMEIKNLQ